jgi:glycosyltransferase involved in cell wall biosynthesis
MWTKIKSIFSSRLQNSERPKFLSKEKKTILIIDDYIPYHDKSSGSKRLFEITKLLKDLNLNVIFLPNDGLPTEPYYSELIELGINVLLNNPSRKHLISDLKSLLPYVDYAWISRPLLNNTYQKLIKQNSKAKIIFDTVDLHYIRMLRQADNESNEKLKRKALQTKNLEVALAHAADATLTVTETEKLILEAENINNVFVIPNIHELRTPSVPISFKNRKGIVFIGGYKHEPNIDAVKWLIDEIMPLVWDKLGQIPVYLLGSNPTTEILNLAKENVIVPGYLQDVDNFFLNSRIFVAPLRYGAGMKGKIGQSLEYGLPIVSTTIGTEGMNLTDGINVLSADDTFGFANKMIELYQDEQLWIKIQQNSTKSISAYTPDKVKEQLKDLLTIIDI